jgi:hypothetical protein
MNKERHMEARSKLKPDTVIILMEGITGAILVAFTQIAKTNPDFTRGLYLGFSAAFLFVLAMVIVFRLRGKRRFGEVDERESVLSGKAALIALIAGIMGLAAYTILAFSVPAAMEIKPSLLATCAMAFLGLAYGAAYLVLSRLS